MGGSAVVGGVTVIVYNWNMRLTLDKYGRRYVMYFNSDSTWDCVMVDVKGCRRILQAARPLTMFLPARWVAEDHLAD